MTRSRSIRILVAMLLTAFLLVSGAFAQQKDAAKKSFVLRGKVEGMNQGNNSLTVNHEKVEGFMDAMTMPYKVDKPDVFKKVKVGDQIKATVYSGDYTLYDIEVVPASK